MGRYKLTIETQRALYENNFFVSSLWQPPSLFPNDGRKLKNVAETGDPWVAQIFYPADYPDAGRPCQWHPMFIQWGKGGSADEAVIDALRKALGAEGRIRKLEAALEFLMETISGRAADQGS